jgi:DNA-binding XRE family transcriptional regulator
MPFVKANMEKEAEKMQELIDSDPELKQFAEEWDKEYEFRKKLVLARKGAGLTQKELGTLSGLDYRAVSRAETSTDVSPSLKTLINLWIPINYEHPRERPQGRFSFA